MSFERKMRRFNNKFASENLGVILILEDYLYKMDEHRYTERRLEGRLTYTHLKLWQA